MMRSAIEVKKRLANCKSDLKETVARFEECDNVEDMNEIPVIEAKISVLQWVLKGK